MRKIKQFRSCPHPTTTLLLFQKLIDEERNLQIQCPSNNRPELFQYPLEILESASVNFLFFPFLFKKTILKLPRSVFDPYLDSIPSTVVIYPTTTYHHIMPALKAAGA